MNRISVIIANHNYERFLGEAIDSALALDWDDIEVIVVDDGSTDRSAVVIRSYGDRIRSVFTENHGQRGAVNKGFALSTGDVVVMLDADDLLPRDLARSVAAAWSPAVAKWQFRMQRIDVRGKPLGDPFPRFDPVPSPDQIRHWASTTSAYPTPPGSGNAYARAFLEQVLPAGPELGRAADSGPLAAAPFWGEVMTLPQVIVSYRLHGANDSDLLRLPSRFAREVERAGARWEFAQRVRYREVEGGGRSARAQEQTDARPLFRSRELLQFRCAAARLTPDEHPLPGDGWVRRTVDAVLSPLHPGPERLPERLMVAAWCMAVQSAPAPLVEPLLRIRYGFRRGHESGRSRRAGQPSSGGGSDEHGLTARGVR